MWDPRAGPRHVSIYSGFGLVETWMTPEAKFRDLNDTSFQIQGLRNSILKIKEPK
jgi:hypothetical protein